MWKSSKVETRSGQRFAAAQCYAAHVSFDPSPSSSPGDQSADSGTEQHDGGWLGHCNNREIDSDVVTKSCGPRELQGDCFAKRNRNVVQRGSASRTCRKHEWRCTIESVARRNVTLG